MDYIISPVTATLQETETHGSFAIEPLHPGYGSTLGNALRRVLLSSLSGSAADYITVEGASHEFSTIPKVSEDVVRILLNVKQLRFALATESAELTLSVKGPKTVTGADIAGNADCEVLTKDQVIATVGEGGTLTMRIGVRQGRGYEPIEKKEHREKIVGTIYLDSFYSPVTAVSYRVENTRVGQMTNYDKLIMEIATDGGIMPSAALSEAASILKQQYAAIAGGATTDEDERPAPAREELIVTEDSIQILQVIDAKTKVEDAGFTSRTASALVAAGYKTLAGLKRLSDIKLQGIKGLGAKGIEEVKAVLDRVA
jgi:DNA-directed RNA polymerase subunit alpha